MAQLTAAPTARVAADVRIVGDGEISIGDYAVIEGSVCLDTGRGGTIRLGPRSKLKIGVILRAYGGALRIGRRTSIGEYSLLASHGGLSIGSSCMFGPYAFVNAAEHITSGEDWYRYQGERAEGVVIGNGVWFGARVSVLDGVTIGDRAVIGAHTLVTADVSDRTVVVGTPSRIVRTL